MSTKTLVVGIGQSDRMLPLLDGTVKPSGVTLHFDRSAVDDIFWRALHSGAFDVTEMSLAAYCILLSRGETPFVGVPVFTSRMFRHNSVYVRAESDVTQPTDLAGRRIGVPEYQMTAVVWMRGILDEYYGVAPDAVEWYTGGVDKPGRVERIPLKLPDRYRVRNIGPEHTLGDYLLEGKIDALITAKMPASFAAGHPGVRRLFPDPRATELEYFERTGIFPIMHVLVLRRSVYEAQPDLARAVYDAFLEAKRVSAARLYDTDALPYMVPWLVNEMETVYRVMGKDFWPYGVAANRACLRKFLDYLKAQDLLLRSVEVDDLFAPEVWDT